MYRFPWTRKHDHKLTVQTNGPLQHYNRLQQKNKYSFTCKQVQRNAFESTRKFWKFCGQKHRFNLLHFQDFLNPPLKMSSIFSFLSLDFWMFKKYCETERPIGVPARQLSTTMERPFEKEIFLASMSSIFFIFVAGFSERPILLAILALAPRSGG